VTGIKRAIASLDPGEGIPHSSVKRKLRRRLCRLDPRYRGRKVEVVRIEGSYAVCMCGPRQVRIRLEHIFSDGQLRRFGYSTDEDNDNPISLA
jgi:hypothetical protein